MPQDQLAEFVESVRKDEALQKALKSATSVDAVVALAAAHGFTIAPEDLVPVDAQVSDTELESTAAGGIYTATAIGGCMIASMVMCLWPPH